MLTGPFCKRVFFLLLLACFGTALFCLAYPLFVIRPFRAQGARELAAALHILQFRGAIASGCALLAVMSAVILWLTFPRRFPRAGVALLALLTVASAALCRVNVYERMFHPAAAPTFTSANQVKLAPGEKILAVQVNGTARAYPVRIIAYHHLVNDTVSGKPIVATY